MTTVAATLIVVLAANKRRPFDNTSPLPPIRLYLRNSFFGCKNNFADVNEIICLLITSRLNVSGRFFFLFYYKHI